MQVLSRLPIGTLYAVLLWPPLASGAYWERSLAVAQLLVLLCGLSWIFHMVAKGRLIWRRSALDLPAAALISLVLLQLALGNHPLASWAFAPEAAGSDAPSALPTPLLTLGTVSPAQTTQALLVLLTYAAVYAVIVNIVRERRRLDGLIQALLLLGGLLAFLGLLDYLGRGPWLIQWREDPSYTGRLSGTFANPDHFATWLAMLVCLGLGYLLARGRAPDDAPLSLRELLGSREGLEQAARRYLPFASIALMTLALIFTLSRGGVLSFLLGLGVFLVLQGALGRARWSVVLVGVLVAVALAYGTWIGLDPLLRRVWQADYLSRWNQYVTTLPMLGSFPLLGVGLGAYREIYFRYQPAALEPARFYYPYAHNDLLQLVVELGLLGAAVCVWATFRVGRDLVGAHLFGRSGCPVGGGKDEDAQRSDPFSVGIATGALAAVTVLLFHSGVDFGARIPANGILAAACLGFATVALHTRFNFGGERPLTGHRALSLDTKGRRAVLIASVLVALALAAWILRTPAALGLAQDADRKARLDRVELALAIDPGNRRALEVRASLHLAAARKIWNSGVLGDGRILTSWEERRRAALPLLTAAIQDLQATVAGRPSNPFLHERLARAHWTAATVDAATRAEHLAAAATHFRRATVLAPEDPSFHRALAVFAASQGGALLEVGLRAARDAVERDPGLLPDLVQEFAGAGLSESQWMAVVPDSALDRLQLAAVLETSGLLKEAVHVYRGAVERASPVEESLARWMLARLLLRTRDHQGATAELDAALKREPDNPELHLARGQALAARGDPAALEAHRAAVVKGEDRPRRSAADALPFAVSGPRARALVAERLGHDKGARLGRYHRALAQYLTDRKLWEQALRAWDVVLAGSSEDSFAHFSRGMVLDSLGARERALDAYRRAVSLDGRSVRFRLRLAQSLWDTDQYYQAMNEWQAVIGQEPGNVEARLALARAHLKRGERVEAVRQYERVLQLAPDHPEARQAFVRLGGILPR